MKNFYFLLFFLPIFITKVYSQGLPTTPQGVECGTNLGFESGNLSNWNGCRYNGTSSTCPAGQQFPGGCPSQCTSTSTSNGVCTCMSCGNGSPPCCPLKCDVQGLQPAAGTGVNGTLGNCTANPGGANNIRHTVTTGTGVDPNSDGNITVVAPGGRNYSVRLGNHEAGFQAECMWQTFAVTKANALFTYMYAVVLQDPTNNPHDPDERPRFEIKITDQNGVSPACGGIYTVVSNNAAAQGFKNAQNPQCGNPDVWYKEWTAVATDLSAYIGQNVTIRFCTADCGQGGHFGYAYVDTYCKPLEILGSTICTTAGNVTLTAPLGFSDYSWYAGGTPVTGNPVGTSYTVTVPATHGAIYTAKVQSIASPGCFTYITDTIVVFTGSASGDTTVCANAAGPVTLRATNSDPSNATYNWSPATGLSCTTCPNPVVSSPYTTQTYSVTMVHPAGCTLTDAVTVTAIPCGITVVAPPATLCPGECASLTATASGGTGPYTFTWNPGGVVNNPLNVCPTVTTTYTVTARDAGGQSATATAVVTVNPIPVITSTPQTICAGNCTSLSASGAGAGGTYTWTPAIGTGAGPHQVCPTATTTYTVRGATTAGCTNSTTVVVNVNPNPVLTTVPAAICAGDNATVSAGGANTYTWSNGNTGPSITVSPTITTTYTVNGTSTDGCTGSATVVVTVNNNISVSVPPDTICVGGTVNLTANGPGGTSYTWSTGEQGPGITVSPLVTTTYSVSATSPSGCTGATAVQVVVNPIPVITANTATICNGVCTSLSASGGATYTWSPTTGLGSSIGSTVSACPSVTTSYTITGTSAAGCTSSTTTIVNVNNSPVLSVNSESICIGSSANLTASGATTYTWNTGPQTAGIMVSPAITTSYTVTGTSAGCTGSAVATVTVNPVPVLTITTDTICSGETATLTTGGAASYTWLPAGTTGTSLSPSPTVNTTYTVIGATAAGCTSSIQTRVIVNPVPVPYFEPDTSACMPLTVYFRNLSQANLGTSSCNWTFTGGVPAASTSCIPSAVTYNTPGVYSVTLTVTSNGCSATLVRPNIITVHSFPKALFTANPLVTDIMEPTITFTNLSTDDSACVWDFGDGTRDTVCGYEHKHTYDDAGTYEVCLDIVNEHLCPDKYCLTVIVKPVWTFYIPNAFSPNGDLRNEMFKGKSWNVIEHEMWIFDRWGNMIYYTGKTKDPESAIGWDGRASGGELPAQEDVYVWLVKIRDIFGKQHKYVGHVTLVK